jgi:hypothetical protein
VASALPRLPGLKASATLPLHALDTARLGLTYEAAAANVSAGVSGLARGSRPAFEAAATVGWQQTVLLGAEAALVAPGPAEEAGKAGPGAAGAVLSRWGACLAYNMPEAQVALSVSEAGGSRVGRRRQAGLLKRRQARQEWPGDRLAAWAASWGGASWRRRCCKRQQARPGGRGRCAAGGEGGVTTVCMRHPLPPPLQGPQEPAAGAVGRTSGKGELLD